MIKQSRQEAIIIHLHARRLLLRERRASKQARQQERGVTRRPVEGQGDLEAARPRVGGAELLSGLKAALLARGEGGPAPGLRADGDHHER